MMDLLKIRCILFLLVYAENYECSTPPNEQAVYFLPNTEYVFLLETKADLESARLDGVVKIGLMRVSDLSNGTGQEILFNIHTMDLTSGGHKALIHNEHDLTKWFSIKMRPNGVIFEVLHTADEDVELVNIKKNIAGMFSGHLQFKGEQGENDFWDYHTHEVGTEGHHRSSYTATMLNEKTIFRKKRLTQPTEHGKSVHEKEIHFHQHLGIADTIKINERFDAPSKIAPGFDPYAGLPDTQSNDTKSNNQKEFPAMSIISQSNISFLYSQETFTPKHPPVKLVRDSLQLKSLPPDMTGFNKTSMWSFIRGNLTCLRKDMQKAAVNSVQGTHCFQKLVQLLLHVPNDIVDTIITSFFPGKNKIRLRDTFDRYNILDALVATHSEYIQDALTNAVFLAASPDKNILERFLMLSTANNKTVSKHFVAVLQDFVFIPQLFPKIAKDQSLKRTAILTLGAIASRLNNINRCDESIDIITRIENHLGINDPWEYSRRLKNISPSLHDDHNIDTATMIEALGNAGFDRSFDHIVSYLNSTDIPSILRRSGLHSLRKFETKEAAEILLVASESDDDKQVRKLADHLYQAHPYGKKMNKSYSYENNSSLKESDTLEFGASNRQRRAVKDNIFNEFGKGLDKLEKNIDMEYEFPYKSSGIIWKSGNDMLGASIGYILRNNFKLKPRLLSGLLEIESHNYVYVRLHVGILGFNVDVASAVQCFDGALEIRINPLKEVKCAVAEQFVDAFDRIIEHYLGQFSTVIGDIRDSITGPESFEQIFEDLDEASSSGYEKAMDAFGKIRDAHQKHSGFSQDALPEMKKATELLSQTEQYAEEVKQNMMKTHETIKDTTSVLQPASEQLFRSTQEMNDNNHPTNFLTSPHTAMDKTYKSVDDSESATDAMVQGKEAFEDADILREVSSQEKIESLQDDVSKMKDKVQNPYKGVGRRKRDVYNKPRDTEVVRKELIDSLDDVWKALNTLKNIDSPIHQVVNRFFDSVKVLKRLFNNLRNSYLDAKSEITKILGPNVHPSFPREIRLDGNGCQSNGFYPSTADGFYKDQGVDLVTNPGQMIPAPFSGSVSVMNDGTKQIRLVPSDGGFINTVIYINNIDPIDTIPAGGHIKIIAGTTVGTPSKTGPCGSRHIHFVVKTELNPKQYIQPRNQRGASDSSGSGIHDSSMYLNDRVLQIGLYQRGCDDLSIKLFGFSLIKRRLTQDIREKDTTPHPTITIDLTPYPGRRKRDTGNPGTHNASPLSDSKSATSTLKDLGLPISDISNPYHVGFKFDSLKTGSVLNFFKGLVDNDIADRMKNVLRSLAILLTNTVCVNPARLTQNQLIRELYKRGQSIKGTRTDMIRRYLNPDNRCPLLQLSLPENTYCKIDQTCLAVECCINMHILFHQISLKAFVRYNPCDSTLTIGIHPWNVSLSVPDQDSAVDQETTFDIELKGLGQQHVKLRYTLENTEDMFLMSLSFCICGFNEECSAFYNVFKELAFMIPTCNYNQQPSWKEVNVLDYLQRAHIITLFNKNSYEHRQLQISEIAKTIGISMDIISNLPKCRSPESFSNEELEYALRTYGKSINGTTGELIDRLSLAMKSCDNITLSAFPSIMSERISCFMSPNCATLECCLRVDVLDFAPSFRVIAEIHKCDKLLVLGFENSAFVIHLNNVTQNGVADQASFGWIKLKYAVRLIAAYEYSFSIDVAVCPGKGDCIVDTNVVRDGKFFIYPCNSLNKNNKPKRTWFQKNLQAPEDNKEQNIDQKSESNRKDDYIKYWRDKFINGNTRLTHEENMHTKVSITQEDSLPDILRRSIPVLPNGKPNEQGNSPLQNDVSSVMDYILENDLSETQSLIDGEKIHDIESVLDKNADLLKSLNDIDMSELKNYLRNVLIEYMENNIDDYLKLNVSSKFQARSFIISGTERFPSYGRFHMTLTDVIFPIPIGGFVAVEFYVGMGAGISLAFPFNVNIGTMTGQTAISPGVAQIGLAGLGLRILIFRLSFEFVIELLGNDVPISREYNFCKFPMEVTDRVDVIVTPLLLRLHIEIKLDLWLFSVGLFRKEIWKWSTPSIKFNLKKKVSTREDLTIPNFVESRVDQFIEVDGERGRRSLQTITYPKSTRSCVVEQIPGLDYTEPAFYIEVAASDDVSYVTYTLSVGTEPGSNEVIHSVEFGGPSAILRKPLIAGVPLYFSIRARNSAGGTATATCHLSTYDTTKPGGRLDAAFITTNHPNILKASAVLHEDSEIAERRVSVGYGSGVWGDQVAPWKVIDSVERNIITSQDRDEFDYFTTSRRGRLVSVPVATHTYLNPQFCARDCLALPSYKCLSFNYDYGPDKTCELLEEIEGHGVQLHQSGLFSHFERLGIGHAIEIDHDNLKLDHNNLYYFNIYTKNVLGYESIISSKGILTDFTPPLPGLIRNAQSDIVIWQECTAFVPEEWQRRCTVTTTFPNHRIIEDGQGSQTVFNGHVDFVDVLYTRANKFISANWDGFYDNETGIYGYTWSVGSDVCMDDVSSHIDPHSHLFDESEWTHEGLVTGVHLEDGIYFISVRALNKVEFGGPMAVSVCHTTPYVIDTTPPIIFSIHNVTYDSQEHLIGVNVDSIDNESGIARHDFGLGRTPRDIDILSWQHKSNSEVIDMQFRIPDGIPAWVKIRAVNNVNLSSSSHSDTTLFVDTTPPIQGLVTDGIDSYDMEYFKDKNMICSSWTDFKDPESGISSYLWSVGTYPGGSDVVDGVTIQHDAHYACTDNVFLQHYEKYFSNVVAFNGGIQKLNTSAESNGVILDLTPPIVGYVFDGTEDDGKDLVYSSEPTSVTAFWGNFTDPESGINRYEVSLHRTTSVKQEDESYSKTVEKLTRSIEWNNVNLHHNDFVHVTLRAINGAENFIDTNSNGYHIDLTPPVLQTIGDGVLLNADIEFQKNTDQIACNWIYADEESGIMYYQLAIYELKHGNKRKIYPSDVEENSFKTIEDGAATVNIQDNLRLEPGAIYTTLVKAINGAKLVSSHETTGIRIDPSPPKMIFVRAGSVDGDDEELMNGYVCQSDRSGIMASWRAVDPESQIKSYWVAVGNQPYSSDIKDFQSYGADHSSYISGLELSLSNECQHDCQPVYYVCVKAENGAGEFSDNVCSSPVKVILADKTGYVTDGPANVILKANDPSNADIDSQQNANTITVTFAGFESTINGISNYQWTIGTTPEGEDVQPYVTDGIVLSSDEMAIGLPGSGKAQALVNLEHRQTYYATVRAVTGSGDILESSSDGVTVDQTTPDITLLELGLHDTRNRSKQWDIMAPVYQSDVSPLTATWSAEDNESHIGIVYYSVGTYPGGNDVNNVTSTDVNYITFGDVRPNLVGQPNKIQIEAINQAGLRRKIVSPSLIIDKSQPKPGQVYCPETVHTRGHLKCSWAGFSDEEGPITRFRFLIGSKENKDDVYASHDIPAHKDYFEVKVTGLSLRHNFKYYITVEAINSVGLKSSASSQPVLIDDTPPIAGTVVELLSDASVNLNNAKGNTSATDTDINDHDAICIESMWHLSAMWEPFHDSESNIVKYEVAVGNVPFGTQVNRLIEVLAKQTNIVFKNIDLSRQSQIFVTVRGFNEAGLFTSTSSNGAYICRLSIGFPPHYPLSVSDGRGQEDRDFQTSLGQLSATWDFTGYPCPFKSYEWAIRRIDGKEVQPFTDVGEQQFGTNSEIDMTDGETYYIIVRGVNMLGSTVTARSDGITVQRDPLIPGHVFDGPFFGTDITYQQSTQVLHASWLGFGQREKVTNTYHTGNDEVVRSRTNDQTVDYYEVAVGTDRSSSKTLDNVVPFTNVGQNTSYSFEGLSLKPLSAVYYITVRAHSVSYASTEVSSNGIITGINSEVTAGKIEVPKFVNSLDIVDVEWSDFQSSLNIKFYYIGIADISNHKFPNMECTSDQFDDENQATFNIFPLRSTNLDTYKKASGLHMKQLGTYAVFVFGIDDAGECNSTSAIFTVDISPPLTGKMKTGPFFDTPLDYTTVKEELQVWWRGFDDPESGIGSFHIQLISASSCTDIDSIELVVEWIKLGGNFTEYCFVDITLLENKPYFVELKVTNNAGRSASLRSAPILFDESIPVAGKVVDGPNYQQDARFHGDRATISGSFLHFASPHGTPCPLKLTHLTDLYTWTSINMKGLWNMNGILWNIRYLPEQVLVSDDELKITIERDARTPSILSGGYSTKAHILRGGHYEVEIMAASGEINAITSIVFWDGSESTVGGFQEPDQDRWWNECACCYKNETCHCDCSNPTSTSVTSSSIQQNQTDSPKTLKTTPWKVESGEHEKVLTKIIPACGLQLIPAGNNSQALLWCRYADDWYLPLSIRMGLPFDPSLEWHNYTLLFSSTHTDVDQIKWNLNLYIDGVWKCELDGIPELSSSAKLVLHVWNKNNYVPALENVFFPPISTARFRALRLPPAPRNLCRYGDPFRGGSSPVVEYRAGVGSEPGKDNIVTFRMLPKPCIPCDGICGHFNCHQECQSGASVPYVFTLSNISLPESRLTDNITAPIFLSVKSVLGNGHYVIASSNGITIDTSPPILDYMFYMDDAKGEFQPVNYQSSNTTIKSYWNFIDEDSEIAENLWAIGTYPGGTDLQDFASVGLEQMGINSSLEGSLHHNLTYYVTLRGINGAGIVKTVECPGVTVLISSPLPDGVNTTVLFSEKLPDDTYPPNSLKTTDSQHVGVEWSKADDDEVTRYEYCVGSSSDEQDDIVECIPVATNSSGSVTISDRGEVNIGTGTSEAKLNMTQFPLSGDFNNTNTNSSRRSSTRLNLEPGKTLVNTIRVCNSANLCSPAKSSKTTIIPDTDFLVQSSEGEDITVTSDDNVGDDGLRNKRSLGSSDYTLDIRTSGGLHKGGSVIFGYLDKERLRHVYESDAVTLYRPYIVNPDDTFYKTSRKLRKRILQMYEPSFYLTSLGQVELNGPLQVNVTMPLKTMNLSETNPTLLFWNPGDQEWQEATYTCNMDMALVFDLVFSRFSVQVCNTGKPEAGHSRSRRVANEQELTQHYFKRETQFVVAQVSNTIVNEPPVLQNLVDVITIKEDQGTIIYKLKATDPEGDAVKFYLDPRQPEAKNGKVTVTPKGLFSYTPCLDCYGEDNITIVAEDIPYTAGIPSRLNYFSLRVFITNEEDEPVLFVAKNGKVVGSSREVFMTAEENSHENNNYQPLSFVVGAFDVDIDERIDIVIQGISKGHLHVIEESQKKLYKYSECKQTLSNEYQITSVPCGLEIPREPENLTWLMRYYKYIPFENVVGAEKLQVLARDKYGLISRHLTINIGILANPCIHGKCKGPVDDLSCTDFRRRSFNFGGYTCECDANYSGDKCQFEPVDVIVPKSANVKFTKILIASSISIMIICLILVIFALIIYCKKRSKHREEVDNAVAMVSMTAADVADIDERSPLKTTNDSSAEEVNDDNEEFEETLETLQEPLQPKTINVNDAELCSTYSNTNNDGEPGVIRLLKKDKTDKDSSTTDEGSDDNDEFEETLENLQQVYLHASLYFRTPIGRQSFSNIYS